MSLPKTDVRYMASQGYGYVYNTKLAGRAARFTRVASYLAYRKKREALKVMLPKVVETTYFGFSDKDISAKFSGIFPYRVYALPAYSPELFKREGTDIRYVGPTLNENWVYTCIL